jgi:hypothetical protein
MDKIGAEEISADEQDGNPRISQGGVDCGFPFRSRSNLLV